MTSPSTVNSRLPGLDPDFLRAGEEDPFFVQVVRSSKNRGGELEHLLHPDVFYDHEVKEPVLRVGPGRREPTATSVAAVADRQVDRAKFALRTVQRQRDLLRLVLSGHLERSPMITQLPPSALHLCV